MFDYTLALAYSIKVDTLTSAQRIWSPILTNLTDVLDRSPHKPLIQIIFAIQSPPDIYPCIRDYVLESSFGTKIIPVYAGESGLTTSRNKAIEVAGSKYIHFLDSDCRFCPHSFLHYTQQIFGSNQDIIFLRSSLFHTNTFSLSLLLSKIGLPLSRVNYFLNSICTPSYGMIISLECIREFNLRFDPLLGLGSLFYQSEEIDFFLQYYLAPRQYTPSFRRLIFPCLYATSRSHLSTYNFKQSMASKGYVLIKHFKLAGYVLLPVVYLIFLAKSFLNGTSKSAVSSIFSGAIFASRRFPL